MISFENLACQAYYAFQMEFLHATGKTTVAWEEMPSGLKAAWIAAARKMHANLATVH